MDRKYKTLIFATVALLVTSKFSFSGEWANDRLKGCLIWDPDPQKDDSVEWVGSCIDGIAQGAGVQRWFRSGKLLNIITGNVEKGIVVNDVEIQYAGGEKYNGPLNEKGLKHGIGFFTNNLGVTYKGSFENDILKGRATVIGYDNKSYEIDFDGFIPKELLTRNNDGIDLLNSRKFNEALKAHNYNLDFAERIFGPDWLYNSLPLMGIGEVYLLTGKYSEAILIYESLLRLGEINSSTLIKRQGLRGLGHAYGHLNNYDKSIEILENYGMLLQDDGQAATLEGGKLYGDIASIYKQKNDFNMANIYFKKSISILQSVIEENPIIFVKYVNVYIQFLRESNLDENAIQTINKILIFYNEKKKLDNNFDKHGVVASDLLTTLGEMLLEKNYILEARSILSSAFELRLSVYGEDDFLSLYTGLHFSKALAANNEFFEAELIQKHIIQKYLLIEPRNSIFIAQAHRYLGLNFLYQKKYTESLEQFETERSELEKILPLNNKKVLDSYFALIEIQNIIGNYNKSLELISIINDRSNIVSDAIFETYLKSSQIDIISNTKAFSLSFLASQKIKSQSDLVIDRVNERILATSSQIQKLIRTRQNLEDDIFKLENKYAHILLKDQADNVSESIYQLSLTNAVISKKLEEVSYEITQSSVGSYDSESKPISVDDVRGAIGNQSALIKFYFMQDEKCYVWVLTKEEEKWVELNINASSLEALISNVRKSLSTNSNQDFDLDASYQIYNRLLKPIESIIEKKKKLYIHGNGPINSLPMNLIITKASDNTNYDKAEWIVKKYSIVNLPSISSLIKKKKSSFFPKQKPLLAFGDPIFNKLNPQIASRSLENRTRGITDFFNKYNFDRDALFENMHRLPGTRREVETIAKILKADRKDVLVGDNATETNFKNRDLREYRIIYFATHGLISGDIERFVDSDAEPAIILSKPKTYSAFDDGILFASEIAKLELSADWVILSACNTASGDRLGAEALSGLAKSFLFAGAQSLLVSHWEVNDRIASEMLPYLFALEAEKLSHGERLQYAILKYLEKTHDKKFLHPKYWAPFMVVGDVILSD